MRRMALVLLLVGGLVLVPGGAWAHHRAHVVVVPCCVFIAPGHAFVPRPFFPHHGFFRPRVFVEDGFIQAPFGSSAVIVTPQPVWVPGFWWWDGFQWIWVPGHWAR